MNVIESNKKEKLQHKTKNDFKYNEHVSDNNNVIDNNSRNTFSTNSTPYSKNDLVQKNILRVRTY